MVLSGITKDFDCSAERNHALVSRLMEWHFWILDDQKSIEEKMREELQEEVGIHSSEILSIQQGAIFHQEESVTTKPGLFIPFLQTSKPTLSPSIGKRSAMNGWMFAI